MSGRKSAGRDTVAPAIVGLAIWATAFAAACSLSFELRRSWWVLVLASALTAVAGGAIVHRFSGTSRSPVGELVSVAQAGMQLRSRMNSAGWTQPKDGSPDSDNEDAWVSLDELGIACVSDGASSSYNAGEWARLLCHTFVAERPALSRLGIEAWLAGAASKFRAPKGSGAVKSQDTDPSWWDDAASGKDAFATFVGLSLTHESSALSWNAFAVGDSVVLHLRPEDDGYRLVSGFPIESSAAFDGSPQLVSSGAHRLEDLPALRFAQGSCQPHDVWLLATDESAKWALREAERGDPIWRVLVDGKNSERTTLLAAARRAGGLANDDMTLLIVRREQSMQRPTFATTKAQ